MKETQVTFKRSALQRQWGQIRSQAEEGVTKSGDKALGCGGKIKGREIRCSLEVAAKSKPLC